MRATDRVSQAIEFLSAAGGQVITTVFEDSETNAANNTRYSAAMHANGQIHTDAHRPIYAQMHPKTFILTITESLI